MNPFSNPEAKGIDDQESTIPCHSTKPYYLLFSLLWMVFIAGYIVVGAHNGKFQGQQRSLIWHVIGAAFLLSFYLGWAGRYLLNVFTHSSPRKFILSILIQIGIVSIIWPTMYWVAMFSFVYQLKGVIKIPMESSFFLWVLSSYPFFFIRLILPFFIVALVLIFVFKKSIRHSQCA